MAVIVVSIMLPHPVLLLQFADTHSVSHTDTSIVKLDNNTPLPSASLVGVLLPCFVRQAGAPPAPEGTFKNVPTVNNVKCEYCKST